MSLKFEQSKIDGPHQQLSKLTGNWTGTSRVWFEPDVVADESTIEGSIKLILGDRFVMHEYKSSMGGKSLEGIMIIGYHLALGKYQCSWVDSFHNGTAMMFCDGKRGETADIDFTGEYSYVTPEKEHIWRWRTQIELKSEDELLITAYNISPEGEESKATEITYQRIK
jgi:hypothetical protein